MNSTVSAHIRLTSLPWCVIAAGLIDVEVRLAKSPRCTWLSGREWHLQPHRPQCCTPVQGHPAAMEWLVCRLWNRSRSLASSHSFLLKTLPDAPSCRFLLAGFKTPQCLDT